MEINLDECKCICENAEIVQAVQEFSGTPLQIALVVIIVILIIVLFIVGFRKLKSSPEDEDLESGNTYY